MKSPAHVYAIADLHLDGGQNKPMNVFGDHWDKHIEKIAADWKSRVTDDDLVLIPGDISWAMYLEDAAQDIDLIASLPGEKVILRGNHDYWWSTITKVREILPPSIKAIQNDAIVYDDFVLAGTRGWMIPSMGAKLSVEDEKIYRREIGRMALSLAQAKQKGGDRPIFVMMHYPPLTERCEPNGFLELFGEYEVQKVVYGHLHGMSVKNGFCGCFEGIDYRLVSADGLQFKLYQVI